MTRNTKHHVWDLGPLTLRERLALGGTTLTNTYVGYWTHAESPLVLAVLSLQHGQRPGHEAVDYSVLVSSHLPDREAVVTCSCGNMSSAKWNKGHETFLDIVLDAWGASKCVTEPPE